MLQDVLEYLDKQHNAAVDRMVDLLKIPSVSTDSAYAKEVRKAAKWVNQHLQEAGLQSQICETDRHPIVLATNCDSPDAPKDAPHILYYGHYDVQPPDPLEKWDTPPFEPTIRDNAVFARGSSDDKGQVCCILEALMAWKKVAGKIPVRVTVLIEGEEECGSGSLHSFVETHKEKLKADVCVISDTTMWKPDTVAITYGLRGLLYFDLKLHGPSRDLHSGMYGGILANPCNEMTRVLGKLFDDDHRVTIPGYYDNVQPVTAEEQEQWDALDFDEMKDCLTPVGVDTPFGEADYTTLQRRWARPACDINGLYGGYGGEGAKTVIPSFAGAKVSFRLAAGQHPDHIAEIFEKWLREQDTHGCKWEITNFGGAVPVAVSQNSPYMSAAAKAINQSSGKEPVLIREGATIPVVGQFKEDLDLDSLLIGFGLTDDAIHSPNEKFNLDCFRLGYRTHAALIAEFANLEWWT
ncbi:MAG: dipeptidase [Phycisphaeraceae bacterium JB051]